MPELVSLEDFLAGEYDLVNCIPSQRQLFDDDWSLMMDTLLGKSCNTDKEFPLREEEGEEDSFEFQPFTTQTQNQILDFWRPEFETPLAERIATALPATSPKTPTLFNETDPIDFDYVDDDEFLGISSQPNNLLTMNSPGKKSSGQSCKVMNTEVTPLSLPVDQKKIIHQFGVNHFFEDNIKVNPVNFVGFSTASGKKVKSPSKDAIAKIEAILREPQDDEPHQMPTFDSSRTPLPALFSTASGKKVKSPSKKAFERAKAVLYFDNIDEKVESKGESSLFLTASGKKVKSPSKKALQKAGRLLNSIIDEPFPSSCELEGMQNSKDLLLPASKNLISLSSPLAMKGKVQPLLSNNTSPLVKRLRTPSGPSKTFQRADPFPSPGIHSPVGQYKNLMLKGTASPRTPKRVNPTIKSPSMTIHPTPLRGGGSVTVPHQRVTHFFDLAKEKDTKSRIELFDLKDFLYNSRHPIDGIVIDFKKVIQRGQEVLPLVTMEWIVNHMEWIVWKLYSYHATGIIKRINASLSEGTIISQLCYRYEREFNLAERSILKRIVERDDSPSSYMVLLVSSLEFFENGPIVMKVSDNWYSLAVSTDVIIEQLVRSGRIKIGRKIKVALAQVISEEACNVLEAGERKVSLKLFGNSTRPARWFTRLGKQKQKMFTVSLSSIDPDGGLVACIKVIVIRCLPTIYTIEWESGQRQTMNQEQLDELFKRQESGTVENFEGQPNKVSSIQMSVKFKARDCCGCPFSTFASVTLWNSNPDVLARLTEGTVLQIVGLKPTMKRNNGIHLSSIRTTKLIFSSSLSTCPVLPIPPLSSPDEFPTLTLQEDYDLFGFKLAFEGDHLWLGVMRASEGERERGEGEREKSNDIGIAAIKFTHSRTLTIQEKDLVLLLDISFLYFDPRHGFPVFLFGEQSQLVIDSKRIQSSLLTPSLPSIDKHLEKFQEAFDFVNNTLLVSRAKLKNK